MPLAALVSSALSISRNKTASMSLWRVSTSPLGSERPLIFSTYTGTAVNGSRRTAEFLLARMDFSRFTPPEPSIRRPQIASSSSRQAAIFTYGQQWVWEDQGLPSGMAAVEPIGAVYQPTLDRIIAFGEAYSLVNGQVNDNGLYDKYWNGQQWVWQSQGFPGPPDFALAVTPPQIRSRVGRFTVTVTTLSMFRSDGVVALSCSSNSATSCGVSPATITGSGAATLTVTSDLGGDNDVTVTATSGALTHNATVTLTVPSKEPPVPCKGTRCM